MTAVNLRSGQADYAGRWQRLRELVAESSLDCLLLVSYDPTTSWLDFDHTIAFATGILNVPHAAVQVTASRVRLLLDEATASEEWPHVAPEVEVVVGVFDQLDLADVARLVVKELEVEPGSRVGVNARKLRGDVHQALREEDLDLVDVSHALDAAKRPTDPAQRTGLRAAAAIGVATVEAMAADTVAGADLRAVRGRGLMTALSLGASHMWFPVLAGEGERRPAAAQLASPGAVVSLAATPVFDGYAADVGRSLVVGGGQDEAIEFAEHVHSVAPDLLRAGLPLEGLATGLGKLITDAGMDERTTVMAHPLGYADEIHPYVGLFPTLTGHPLELVPGMALTVEVVVTGDRGMAFVEDAYFLGTDSADCYTRAREGS